MSTDSSDTPPLADRPTLVELVAEFNALTPLIEVLKRRAGHDGCDGWSMGGEPYAGRCGCGALVEEMAAEVMQAEREG